MPKRLPAAPKWVVALLYGVPFGIVTGVYSAAIMTNLTMAGRVYVGVVAGMLVGALFGFLLTRLTSSQHQSMGAAVQDVPAELQAAALLAGLRGPAPTNPMVRRAALRVAQDRLQANERRRWFTTVAFTGLILLYVTLALTSSPWWWIGVAFFTGLLTVHLTSRRRLRRRIALLSDDPLADGTSHPRSRL
ncbi:hypothetical protein CIW49_21120 [Mycolicibacterium sp. P1-18]|uniref:hypothetical protein n=1 Tax=Mycolicibacterium sp. P1-18 TaxID=2024615 RepID=UPI0011F3CF8C|nr:hypothetical protein [Mycolicibacterium sp. P1-18]KAA0096040.1 hypothetical protein CIW49_21120 [Mycolicibacterium sp. P1-18]